MGWHRSGSHSFHELLFWKLIFVCQSVKWHYCLKKGGSGAGKLEDFLQGPINGKETSEELCSYGWILPRPLLVSCRCGHLWDRPAAACWWCFPQPHTPEEPDREQNTQLTYPKLIHFLVSLLCMECWPEFYSPSCLVLPLWEKKDVFCDKKDSELSECHVFWCPEQCSFIAL